MFYDCTGLTSLDVSHFNTSQVEDMQLMFKGCSSLTSLDVSHFDTSKVTDMHWMFYQCIGLTSLDVSHFNTSQVTNMMVMFKGCSSLTSLTIGSGFEVKSNTTTDSMFDGCNALKSGTLRVRGVAPNIQQNIFSGFTGTLITDVDLTTTWGGTFSTVTHNTAYAVLSGDGNNKTLTFKYGEHTVSGDNEWDVSNTTSQLWFSQRDL